MSINNPKVNMNSDDEFERMIQNAKNLNINKKEDPKVAQVSEENDDLDDDLPGMFVGISKK